jgi:LemA protein
MKKSIPVLLIILGVIGFLAVYIMGFYNRMVSANETVDNAWAQVETQYQRRFDLIPNLVESVKGIMEQEQEVFGTLADARTRYAGAATTDEKAAAAGQLDSALARLLVIIENYPELKSAENVTTLMAQVEGTENRIGVERKRYNDEVRSFNVMVKQFPGRIFASVFGFEERVYFESTDGASEAPKIEF